MTIMAGVRAGGCWRPEIEPRAGTLFAQEKALNSDRTKGTATTFRTGRFPALARSACGMESESGAFDDGRGLSGSPPLESTSFNAAASPCMPRASADLFPAAGATWRIQ